MEITDRTMTRLKSAAACPHTPDMAIDLRAVLADAPIHASAPGRIDCGGGWDLKGFAITHERIQPSTVNLAVDLRTTVTLDSADDASVSVAGERLGGQPKHKALPFIGPHGLIFAVVSHFGVTGVRITINSDIPPQSGLGGSGVLAVALIAALSQALSRVDGRTTLSEHEAALLAHHIEDGLHISHTGLQDQLAAAYGGVNQWIWRYSDFGCPYERKVLLPSARLDELRGRLLVAYSGSTHESKTLISQWVQSFREPAHRDVWLGINEATHALAEAIRNTRWNEAEKALRREAALWDTVCPEVWTSSTGELRRVAEEHGCGARFTGAGGGGCCWALGAADRITEVRSAWETLLQRSGSGRLLSGEVTDRGLTILA